MSGVLSVLMGDNAAGGGDSTAATNFLAQASGLDSTHINAYKALLNGLTTDGLFNSDGTSSYLDVLYIFATQDETNALLNLCSTNFGGINFTGLTHTPDVGFVGDSSNKILTLFNPTTATTPNYTQNSAHFSQWNLTTGDVGAAEIGLISGSGQDMYASFAGSMCARVNDNPDTGGFSVSDPRGHLLGNRSSSTARQLYQNGSTTLIGGTTATYGSSASQAPNNSSFMAVNGSPRTMAAFSIGGSLNSTQVTNFYNRLRTYMTVVGVP